MRKNQRVTFETLTTSLNDEGIETRTWTPVKELWASVEHRNGSQKWTSGGYTAETTELIRINWTPSFTPNPSHRLVWSDRAFDIQSVSDINEEHREVEIRAKLTEQAQGR